MKPLAIVDVDNVLWDFASLLYQSLKLKNPKTPHWLDWNNWEYPEQFVTKKEFYSIIDDIHKTQEAGQPFAHASRVLDLLSKEYYIVIASHRRKEYKNYLSIWMRMNGLRYNEIYCGQDKTELFDNDVGLIIDDSPIILEKAIDRYNLDTSMAIFGIVYPWNISLKNGDRSCAVNWRESLKDLYMSLKWGQILKNASEGRIINAS